MTPVDFHTPTTCCRTGRAISTWTCSWMPSARAGRPHELLLPHAQAVPPQRAEIRRPTDLLDDKAAMKISCAWKSGSSTRPTRPAKPSASSSSSFLPGPTVHKARIEIGGREVDLANVTMPILNIFAKGSPGAAGFVARAPPLAGTRELHRARFKGGHIGIYVSGEHSGSAVASTLLAARAAADAAVSSAVRWCVR